MKTHTLYLIPVALFVCVLGFVALTINAKTQVDFNLQQMGVESIVERHTFALEGSKVPELQPLGDTFSFRGHMYAIKQPGQFVLGAVVYSIMHAFGVTYQENYVLSSALVTFFTSGMLCAGIGLSLYFVARRMESPRTTSFLIGLCGTIGTILLPYSGVAHHDVQATAFVCIGWSLLFASRSKWKYFISGVLVGGALFISMLPVVVCIGVGLYVISLRQFKMIVMFTLGGLIGVVPVFLYNWLMFGNLLAFPNAISGTTDTTPFLSLANTLEKLQFYLLSPVHSLFVFMPILSFALIGLLFFERKYRREAMYIIGIFLCHLAYISSIETVGHAQYGPRYLLPILPFLSIGLVRLKDAHPIIIKIAIGAGFISFCIALLGAFGGVMYQTIWIHPFLPYATLLFAGELSTNPLQPLGIVLLALCSVMVYLVFSTRLRKV